MGNNIIRLLIVIVCVVVALFIALTVLSAVMNRRAEAVKREGDELWRARKRTFLGFPLSFTVYSVSPERLFIKTGLLTTVENEVRLYRIMDLQLRQTLGQRILGLGSIIVKSSDKSMKNFEMVNIPHARDVKELISENVEKQRQLNRVSNRELMTFDSDDDGDDDSEDII